MQLFFRLIDFFVGHDWYIYDHPKSRIGHATENKICIRCRKIEKFNVPNPAFNAD